MSTKLKILSQDIATFLKAHAGKNEDEEYTSPDAYELVAVQHQIEEGSRVKYPNSSWESGGFRPYSDKAAKAKFTDIMERIKLAVDGKLRG